MKYTRSTLAIIKDETSKAFANAPSVCVGDWHAHLCLNYELGDGVTVSHKCGIAGKIGVTPIEAIRLLKAYQSLPPCPVSDEEFVRRVSSHTVREHKAFYEWLSNVARVTRDVLGIQMPKMPRIVATIR